MYQNRDISWLSFNGRVLQEAADTSVPLIERVRFLAIFSSNMDEFFRVRYPVVSLLSQLKNKTLEKIVPHPDPNLAERVQEIVSQQLNEFGHIINHQILPALEANGINLYYNRPVPPQFNNELRELFFSRVLSYMQPVFLDGLTAKDFFPQSNRIYFFVLLAKEGRPDLAHAVVNIPVDKLSRFVALEADNQKHIIFIDDIIRENLNCIFPGYEIHSSYSFKVTRDSELHLDEESVSRNIMKQMEKQLQKRDLGHPTRFLYERTMPLNVLMFLADALGLRDEQLYEGGRYHNLSDFSKLPIHRADLEYPPMEQLKPTRLAWCGDIFREVEKRDLLLHFPYESYNPVLAFFNQAAIDPDVESISVTLYRVAPESHIVNALISAAKNKKQVQVFVELKARFDEANNIKWSKEMVKAGVKMIYSIPKIKVHSKIALVTRKSGDGVKGYAFVGTGNFNEVTARFYTDHALFTARDEVIADLKHLFSILVHERLPKKDAVKEFTHLLVSQYNMVNVLEEEINRQIQRQRTTGDGLIRVKVNNLEDVYMIDLLYKASQAGVRIDLLVRGICSLLPGREDVSRNITVKRIVGRYLEHSRIMIFGPDDDSTVYIGSADWMRRNLQQRIEVCAPVPELQAKEELIRYFTLQWNDNVKVALINSEGQQVRPEPDENAERLIAQDQIYEFLKSRQ